MPIYYCFYFIVNLAIRHTTEDEIRVNGLWQQVQSETIRLPKAQQILQLEDADGKGTCEDPF